MVGRRLLVTVAGWMLGVGALAGIGVTVVGVLRRWWDVPLGSGWVVAVLGAVALTTTIIAGSTWDAPRYRRLRRSGLLMAIQIMTAITLAAAVNLAGGFYGSLSDLLGVHRVSPTTLVEGPKTRPTAVVEPWLATARKTSGTGRGVWTSLTLTGRRTGYALPAWVYVPDAYFNDAEPTRRFPVVFLLAGYPGAVENWERQGHIVSTLDHLMAAGKIPPMILVSVSQNPQADRDSECVDAVGGAQADTYITQDVPESLTEHLRIQADRASWSLMGYSTGGYCAVNLALRHSDRFSAAVSLDGYFAPAIDATTGDLFHNDAALRRAYTPELTIRDHRDHALRFYLLVGNTEAKAKTAAKEFASATHLPDTATVVDIPGGHNWGTWTSALPAALTWLTSG
jgi:enterochelin esterase-like enzyme